MRSFFSARLRSSSGSAGVQEEIQLRLLAAALVMCAVLAVLQAAIFPLAGSIARLGGLAVLVGAGLAAYFGAAHLLGGLSLREAREMLRRKRR